MLSVPEVYTTPSPTRPFTGCTICGRSGPGSYVGESCGACASWAAEQTTDRQDRLITRVERLLALRRRRISARQFAESLTARMTDAEYLDWSQEDSDREPDHSLGYDPTRCPDCEDPWCRGCYDADDFRTPQQMERDLGWAS